jgi:hypothetical protein
VPMRRIYTVANILCFRPKVGLGNETGKSSLSWECTRSLIGGHPMIVLRGGITGASVFDM